MSVLLLPATYLNNGFLHLLAAIAVFLLVNAIARGRTFWRIPCIAAASSFWFLVVPVASGTINLSSEEGHCGLVVFLFSFYFYLIGHPLAHVFQDSGSRHPKTLKTRLIYQALAVVLYSACLVVCHNGWLLCKIFVAFEILNLILDKQMREKYWNLFKGDGTADGRSLLVTLGLLVMLCALDTTLRGTSMDSLETRSVMASLAASSSPLLKLLVTVPMAVSGESIFQLSLLSVVYGAVLTALVYVAVRNARLRVASFFSLSWLAIATVSGATQLHAQTGTSSGNWIYLAFVPLSLLIASAAFGPAMTATDKRAPVAIGLGFALCSSVILTLCVPKLTIKVQHNPDPTSHLVQRSNHFLKSHEHDKAGSQNEPL
ncbi:MAG TPA: YwiC-like family protein [Candidatus Obscuribacterales bacterium]